MIKKYEPLQNDTKQTESGKTLYLIIEKHELWLATDGREGVRANLEGSNLRGANLMETIGNMEHVKSVFCDTYPVTYTAEVMQVGCERHKIEDWWNFDDERIIGMDGKTALKWWRKWKPILQHIIETSPAIETEYVDIRR